MKKLLIILIFGLFSCTENKRAKEFGGSAELKLPDNSKLVNVTWKNDDLWYMTRPMTIEDSAVTYTFTEESSYGIFQGTYTIIETKLMAKPVEIKPDTGYKIK